MDESLKDKLKAAAGVVFVIIFAVVVFQNAGYVRELAEGYGLVGIFIASIIANATVLLPMPIDIVIIAVNAQSNSLLEVVILGGIVGAGAAIGEMTAYIAGLFGVETAEKIKESEFSRIKDIREKIEKLGMKFIFLIALVPFPFDIIGITAGFIRYDPKKFFVAAFFGKTCRYILLGASAYFGFAYFRNIPAWPF